MAYPTFAPLPPDQLVPAKATTDRARMARPQQQRQTSAWPGQQFAPLPRRCWSHGARTIATTTRKVDPPPATLRFGLVGSAADLGLPLTAGREDSRRRVM
jgi:hypothetical protein